MCNSCNKGYSSPSSLFSHTKYIHEEITHTCNICQFQTSQKSILKNHIKSVHLKEKDFPCKICDYRATQSGNLSRHVKNVHEKSDNIMCDKCKNYIQKISLKKHLKQQHDDEATLFNCKNCTFQTVYSANLKKHVKIVHQKISK